MENRQVLVLDFKQRSIFNVKFVQGDINSSVLEFRITNGGAPVDISGQTITVSFHKPDGTIVIQDSLTGVTVVDAATGKVQCVLSSNTLAVTGIVKGEVDFSTEGTKLSTAQFTFNVTESLDNGDMLSVYVIQKLDAKIIDIQSQYDDDSAVWNSNTNDKIAEATAKIAETEATRQLAITATTDADEATIAANAAEVLRASAEGLRVVEEENRDAAEGVRISAEDLRETAEDLREVAEASRVIDEDLRDGAEESREATEIIRISAESSRLSAESTRAATELVRVSAESSRVGAEATRVSQEANRQGTYNTGILTWKAPVANFAALASTYPAPSAGWCAQTLDNNQWYRYSGTAWEYKGNFSITGAATVVDLTVIDVAKAGLVRSERHSGVVNYLPITTGSTTNLKSITIPETTYSVNGYEITMPLTVVTLPAADTTGTREDLVFLETWFPSTGSRYVMSGRYRSVAGANFVTFTEGLDATDGVIPNYGVQTQGGNVSPLNYGDGFTITSNFAKYGSFYSPSRRGSSAIEGKNVYASDIGLYVAGDGTATSKTQLATFDGYSYAIPLFRVKRRNSGGFSVGNFGGGRGYYQEIKTTNVVLIPYSRFSYITLQNSLSTNIKVGDKVYLPYTATNHIINTIEGYSVGNKIYIDSDSSWSNTYQEASTKFYVRSDRPDSLYANVIDARDIPPSYDLRHRVQAQFNYDYEARKASDQFMRGELSPKKLLHTYHGITKTEVDVNTVFYASLDATLVPEFPLASSAMNLGTGSFKPMPTGSGYKFNGDSVTPVAVSGLNASEGTIDLIFNKDDLVVVSNDVDTFVSLLNVNGYRALMLSYKPSLNRIDVAPIRTEGAETANVISHMLPVSFKGFHSLRLTWSVSLNVIALYVDGVSVGASAYATPILTPTQIVIGNGKYTSTGFTYPYKGTLSDISISNIDRGAIFPNLPADFISGDAQIMTAYTEQRRVNSQAQMTQLVNGLARVGTVNSSRGVTTSRATGSWASADTITVKGAAGELISGVFDTDTALAMATIQSDTSSVAVLTLDSVSKIIVNDTIAIYHPTIPLTHPTIFTVTAVDETLKTITLNTALTGWTLYKGNILWIMETTASSSSPLVSHMAAGVKTTTVGSWATPGTNVMTFTLGTNAGLTTGDVQIDYSMIMPAGQPAVSVPLTTILGGEAGFRIPTANQTITSDYVGKLIDQTWGNPNIAKTLSAIVASNPAPSTFVDELATSEYAKLSAVDGNSTTFSTSVNGEQACVLLSFDLIKIAERKLGCKIPAKDLAGKVAWMKSNVSGLTPIVWAYGTSPTGNRAEMRRWDGAIWPDATKSTTSASPALLTYTSVLISTAIDSNGVFHVIVYANPSDGATPSIINVDFASIDITFASKVTNSFKLVPGTLAVRDDFAGKVAGSTVVNPNVVKWWKGNVLREPSHADWTEIGTSGTSYTYLDTLNGILNAVGGSPVNLYTAQQLFSVNLIRIVEDKYAPIPALDKVQWLKDNLSQVMFNWWGYGSSPVATVLTYKATTNIWNVTTGAWSVSPNSSTYAFVASNPKGVNLTTGIKPLDCVDVNGFIHFIAYADPSDGTTASTIYTDYCNIELTFKAMTGYDQLVPENPRRDAGMSSVLFVRKETKEVQSMFPTTNEYLLSTYADYLEAPTAISANTDVTILAEIPEFLITDLGSAVGNKQGTHHWMNPAYRVGQDRDELYGELGFSSVPFAPDSVGVNVGTKISVSTTGLAGSNVTNILSTLAIAKPLVHIARFLVLHNGELKMLVISGYTTNGTFACGAVTGRYAYLVSLTGKPLSKELEGAIRSWYFNPTQWRTNPLVVQGFVDKATNKLITTNNEI